MIFSVSEAAIDDVSGILSETRSRFGERQFDRYSGIIEACFALIAGDPLRASSAARPDLGAGMRSLRLDVAAGRRRAAAHVAYYVIQASPGDMPTCTVLRVLHEQMDAARWLPPAQSSG